MNALVLIFLVLALVCFLLAAFNVASGRVNLMALGLMFWVATQIPGLVK